ncbi:Pfa5p [Saccharomyces cerevisiae x Saccharomyces kudriavzevii VIN7]|uniref:Palmitoyltransferase n=1 Tax=Saccharomyces cerevisiae x Saccharomyces kudriavzevii (strain VIN7) TaxID=1095631 RepID=H0GTE9_SACCK|nr:Pfa5p [Saccharomyces cerevisiae x Saccharomyces kudriavzevii VIN7]
MALSWNIRLKRRSWFRFVLPTVVLGLLCYCTWAYCHKLCYQQIDGQFGHRSVAIGLICVVCFLDVVVIFIWLQMVVWIGPGKQPLVAPFLILPVASKEETNDGGSQSTSAEYDAVIPPKCYQSDPHGYPIWCSPCQSLKTERTHHSSELGHCVPRFDHYCMWAGTVIGRDNYRLFVQFVAYFSILLLIMWASICVYTKEITQRHHSQGPRINVNVMLTLAFAILGWLLTTSTLGSAIFYMSQNKTSLEAIMDSKRKKFGTRKIFSYYSESNKLRFVVEFDRSEFHAFWSKKTILANVKDFMGPNMLMWLIPLGKPFILSSKTDEVDNSLPSGRRVTLTEILGPYEELYSDYTIQAIEDKIAKGNYLTTFRAFGDDASSAH